MRALNFALFSAITLLFAIFSREGMAADTASPSASPAGLSADTLNSINLERAPSAVPAFDALGLSPETVTTPSTPRELIADLINGVDRNGVLQQGIALETTPFRLMRVGTNLGEYRHNALSRLAYNFSVSIATSKAVEKSDAVQLALGLKEVLWESADHDPYRNGDLRSAFKEANLSIPLPDELDSGPLPQVPTSAAKVFQSAVDEFYKDKWHGAIWTAAIAPTWNSESGKLSDLSGTGFTTWTAFAYGLPKDRSLQIRTNDPINVQFVAELRYRDGEQVTDPNDKTHVANQNTFLAAGRFRFGSDTFNGFAEGGYVRVWHGLNGDDDGWRGAVGLEKKIAPNVWLVLSAGQQFGGGSVQGNELFVLSSLRFGTADKAQFK